VRRMLWASVVAPLLVAACTGSNGHVARSACDLVTNAEVEQVTAAKVVKSGPVALMASDPGSTSSNVGQTACSFDTNASFGAVLVVLQHPGLRAFTEARLRQPMDGSALTEVPGLGDQAFTTHESVSVLLRDAYVTISSQGETAGFSAKAIQLARIALTRAP
jgi:hypothetical protein